MNTIVIFDSLHGNTQKIAEAIGAKIAAPVASISDDAAQDLRAYDLVIVGSPTQGGTAKATMLEYLKALPSDSLKDTTVACFDTRFAIEAHGFGLKMLMKTIGFAAEKMAKLLKQKGARQIVAPEGFIVTETEGPLAAGEIERAEQWALLVVTAFQET